jgi:integrase
LEERKNKAGTADAYLNLIGVLWLKADKEELENFLNLSILDKPNELKECLNRFLVFCNVNSDVPSVSTFHNLKKSDNLVRAGFISEELYFELIQKINKSSQRSQDIGMFVSFFFFAYRTGLRLTEIKKLRIRDVEDSDVLWIYVRPNQHKDNKTFSGYRKFNQ